VAVALLLQHGFAVLSEQDFFARLALQG